MLDIIIDVYLITMGIVILVKGIRMTHRERSFGVCAYPLGFVDVLVIVLNIYKLMLHMG